MPLRPILILGVPRSGTTWTERVLGSAPGLRVVHEPDNETNMPWALMAKSRLGRFPCLSPGQPAPAYESLWREACSGAGYPRRVQRARWLQQRGRSFDMAEAACDPGRRLGARSRALALLARPAPPRSPLGPRSRALVKSVHAVLCADWLAHRLDPQIVVVLRDPVEVAASWRALGARNDGHSERLEYAGAPERILSSAALAHLSSLYGAPPGRGDRALIWLAGSLMGELRSFARHSADAIVLDFDAACADPRRVLATTAEQLGLRWGAETEAALAADDGPGEGWEVTRETRRVPGAWRRRLATEEIAHIEHELDRVGVRGAHRQHSGR